MEVTTTIDMIIPMWGVLVAMVFGAFYIIKMKFELDQLSKDLTTLGKDLKEIKDMVHALLVPDK